MSSIAFSFVPGEIIAPGTILELQADRDVHLESAEDGVRFIQDGNHLPAGVIVKGNIIKVPTDNLSPASYRISVSRLPGIDGQPLIEPTEVPFVVGGLKGTIPSGFRAIHAVYLAVGDTSTTRLLPGERAPAGTTYLEIVKAVNVKTWESVRLAFDDKGEKIDGQKLLAGVDARRFAKFGHVHETLWNHLQKPAGADAVPIVVWPKIDHKLTNYEKPSDQLIKAPPPEEREHLKVIRGHRAKIVDKLKQLGATVEEGGDNIPFAAASLAAGKIKELAKFDGVGLVSFDDRAALLDLPDSIAIARAALPQGRGITGKDIHVAVFERGPDDTTKLAITDRFDKSPNAPTSSHSRLVSAIIKNVQTNGPHGYAPDCGLYSANSYDNAALDWAVADGRRCTVINQSFHRPTERTTATLSTDDIRKDWMAINYPYPTIVHAAGNKKSTDPQEAYVVHKGFNTLSIGNHDDNAAAMAASSLRRNPASPHSDRELPELCANGVGVTAVGLTMSGTSFSSPAVTGTVALLQQADNILKWWPEGCRAILLASAGRNVRDSTWWNDVLNGVDAYDGAGALDADAGVKIAQKRKLHGAGASVCGWDVGTLRTANFDKNNRTTFHYSVLVPDGGGIVKVALAWDSKVSSNPAGGPLGSVLTVDFDLFVLDSNGNVAAHSSSYDNSYEIAEFQGTANKTYDIFVVRWSGTDDVWYGVAWTVFRNGVSLAPP